MIIYINHLPPIMETRFHSIDQNIVSGFREACGGKIMFSATMKVKVTRCCSSNLPFAPSFPGRPGGWFSWIAPKQQLEIPGKKYLSILPETDIATFSHLKNGCSWNTIVWFSYIGIPPIFRCELLVSGQLSYKKHLTNKSCYALED